MDIKSLIPLIVIQFTFQITALAHLIYKKKTQNLSTWIWAGIILVAGIFGPILYFSFGRSED